MAVQGPDLDGEDLLAIANLRILLSPNIFSTFYRKLRPDTFDVSCSSRLGHHNGRIDAPALVSATMPQNGNIQRLPT
jgi:hypothetical protein